VGNIVTCGFPISNIDKIYGVAKIYTTYVGNMNFQSDDPLLEKLQILGNEFGATTSRKRQCNWLNLNELQKAIYICGVTDLIINKCDIIIALDYYHLYHNYKDCIFKTWDEMKNYIIKNLPDKLNIVFSYDKNII
jgi:adenylosuccinate synthase